MFNAPADGVFPWNFVTAVAIKKLVMILYQTVERFSRYVHSYVDTIAECDGQTDGQICQNNIALCMHRHADER